MVVYSFNDRMFAINLYNLYLLGDLMLWPWRAIIGGRASWREYLFLLFRGKRGQGSWGGAAKKVGVVKGCVCV